MSQQPAEEGGLFDRDRRDDKLTKTKSPNKQRPKKKMKSVHAAVVAKNITTGYLSFQLTKQIPSRKMKGGVGRVDEKRVVGVGGGAEEKTECRRSEKIHRASKV